MIYKKLGENIRLERLKQKLTQEELSEMLDISTSYLGRIERGERNIPLATLVRIADILDVSVDYLLKDSTDKYSSNSLSFQFNQLTSSLSDSQRNLILDMVKLMVSHFKNN